MAAAEVSATVVSKRVIAFDTKTGTTPRVIEYYITATKATQNDWILLEGAIGSTTGTLVGASGIVIDSSSDMAGETLTYDDSADKLVLAGATVGTAKLFIRMALA